MGLFKNIHINDLDREDVHVLNWGCHGDLMAEVSGRRWASRYHNRRMEHSKGVVVIPNAGSQGMKFSK